MPKQKEDETVKPIRINLEGWVETISEGMRKALRQAACPPGQATLWLHKELDDGQLAELYFRMFKRNEDFRDIAFMVKNDWGKKPKWQLRDFVPGLKKWKEALSTTFSEYMDMAETPKSLEKIKDRQKVQKKLSEELDIMEKLAYAIEVNSTRLQMAHERELMAKIPLRITDEVTRTLGALCANYAAVAVKTGVIEQAPSELNINFKAKADMVLERYIGNDGTKMIKAANAFLEGLHEKCVTMNLDPETGEYKLAGSSTTKEDR